MLKLTVLVENTVRRRDLAAEHGLSFWLETENEAILFDAGQSDAYRHNARVMGIDLQKADRIILSHGHYDHGNGLAFFPFSKNRAKPVVHLHPDMLLKRLAADKSAQNRRSIGLSEEVIKHPELKKRAIMQRGLTSITDAIALLSEIPDIISDEGVSPGFLIERDGNGEPDRFLDEQILISRQESGLVILCGCCHPGLIQTLEAVRHFYPDDKIQAILGGFHLSGMAKTQRTKLIQSLKSFSFEYLVPMHCTGLEAWCELKNAFGERCLLLQTGDTLTF
jgi:7,8-dihydropterin-6-yl-methyl-4-(beta-D-ribofuranosyl)aminobenzene 5'-phosphate synthase